MEKHKYHFMPRTKGGRWFFWIAVLGFVSLYLNYWIAMATGGSAIWTGFMTMALILIGGIGSIFSILKYKDYAIGLFLAGLIGLFGILLVIGELLFPH